MRYLLVIKSFLLIVVFTSLMNANSESNTPLSTNDDLVFQAEQILIKAKSDKETLDGGGRKHNEILSSLAILKEKGTENDIELLFDFISYNDQWGFSKFHFQTRLPHQEHFKNYPAIKALIVIPGLTFERVIECIKAKECKNTFGLLGLIHARWGMTKMEEWDLKIKEESNVESKNELIQFMKLFLENPNGSIYIPETPTPCVKNPTHNP